MLPPHALQLAPEVVKNNTAIVTVTKSGPKILSPNPCSKNVFVVHVIRSTVMFTKVEPRKKLPTPGICSPSPLAFDNMSCYVFVHVEY